MDVQVNCTSDNNTIRKDPTLWDVYASAMVTAPTGDPEYFFTSCTLDESASNNGQKLISPPSPVVIVTGEGIFVLYYDTFILKIEIFTKQKKLCIIKMLHKTT